MNTNTPNRILSMMSQQENAIALLQELIDHYKDNPLPEDVEAADYEALLVRVLDLQRTCDTASKLAKALQEGSKASKKPAKKAAAPEPPAKATETKKDDTAADDDDMDFLD